MVRCRKILPCLGACLSPCLPVLARKYEMQITKGTGGVGCGMRGRLVRFRSSRGEDGREAGGKGGKKGDT